MTLEEIASKYDPSSPEGDFDYWLIQFHFDTLKEHLIGEKVVELGCARGVVTEKLADSCKSLAVVEGSQRYLEHVKGKLADRRNLSYHHSLWQDFDYKDGDASDVVFFSGLEHLKERDAISVLKKARSWLRDGGRLHVVVPNAFSLHRRVAVCMGIIGDVHELSERDRLLGHERVYDMATLSRELKQCGYRTLASGGIFLKPLTNQMMMKLDYEIIKGFYRIGPELPEYCAHIYAVCEK